ncbi:type II toxin-antitoxin system Phd/YefM family antitoxin [Lysobacter sp. 2RAF19]
MALTLKLDAIEDLPHTPASDVKKFGWRALMQAIASKGKVVVTNHNQPQAVILSMEAYDAILEAFRAAAQSDQAALDALRTRFDARLAALQAPDAGDRLRKVARGGAKLSGKVKSGATD